MGKNIDIKFGPWIYPKQKFWTAMRFKLCIPGFRNKNYFCSYVLTVFYLTQPSPPVHKLFVLISKNKIERCIPSNIIFILAENIAKLNLKFSFSFFSLELELDYF